MGKWNYRRRWTPKNYYRDQRIPSPPTYYETEYQLRGAWKNVDLPWEERFCISVGIPWDKIVDAKKYMNSYDNVMNWNDSASEATFSDAKKRFWEKINDNSAPDPQPDPDMYNHDIDWNPKIDLELIKDLDRAYFNPDEAHRFETYDGSNSNNYGFTPGCIIGLDDLNKVSENPCERSNGWNCSNKSLNKNISDPWERGINQDDKEIKDSGWGGGGDSWHNNMMRGGGGDKSWKKVDDVSKNSWGCFGNKETGWRDNRNSCATNGWDNGHGGYAGTSQGNQQGRQRGNYRCGYSGRWKHEGLIM